MQIVIMKFNGFFALVTDFYSINLCLVIEVDGCSLETEEAFIKNSERQKILKKWV